MRNLAKQRSQTEADDKEIGIDIGGEGKRSLHVTALGILNQISSNVKEKKRQTGGTN